MAALPAEAEFVPGVLEGSEVDIDMVRRVALTVISRSPASKSLCTRFWRVLHELLIIIFAKSKTQISTGKPFSFIDAIYIVHNCTFHCSTRAYCTSTWSVVYVLL